MGKFQSKRQSFKDKYKVQRKVKEYKRKLKRLAKANPLVMRRAKKSDPGVPNLWPWKEALMDSAEEQRVMAANAAELAKQAKKAAKEEAQREAEREALERAEEYKTLNTPEGKRKWYFRELKKVVEASDVILQVLDARDPLGCRATDIEEMIKRQQNPDGSPSKRLVLILNKIDMVPPENVAAWVQYLRRFYPTLPFKATTQHGSGHLGSLDVKTHKASAKALSTTNSVGGQTLLQLLKNYARTQDVKKSITVGVIGYPNVGKSSIINSLKRARAVQVSAAPGCTRVIQEVRLDSNIMLVDSPGVLFAAEDDGSSNNTLLLRNVLRVEQIEDPQMAVEGILERCNPELLMTLYQIPAFSNIQEFLLHVAHRRGKLGMRNIPNLDDAARVVLQDWNNGKIPFYTQPPAVDDVTETKIVDQFAEKFDVDALLNEGLARTFAHIHAKNPHGDSMDGGDDMEEEAMAEDENDDEEINVPSKWQAVNASKLMSSGVVVMEEDDDDSAEVDEERKVNRSAIGVSAAAALYQDGKAATYTLPPELQAAAAAHGGRLPKKLLDALARGDSMEAWTSAGETAAEALGRGKAGRSKIQAIELGGNIYGGETGSSRVADAKKQKKKAEKEKRRALARGEVIDNDDYDINVDWE